MKKQKKILSLVMAAAIACSVPAATASVASAATDDTKIIAAWNFDNTGKAEGNKLKEYGNSDGYEATEGLGTLTLSVDGESTRALEWSAPEYGASSDEIVPIMAAGKNNLWGTPYIQFAVDATDYEDITFTASFAGSNKAPAVWQLSYSTDGEDFTDVEDGVFTITQDARKVLTAYLSNVSVPENADGAETLIFKLTPVSMTTVEGGDTSNKPSGGEIALNDIVISGVVKAVEEPTPDEPTPDEPTPDEPTPDEPTPDEPTPDKPTLDEPTPDEPTPDEPTPDERDEVHGTMGDLDGDGAVTINDATVIQKGLAELVKFTDAQKVLADVNGDGIVTISDVTCIQKYLAGYSVNCGTTGVVI